MRRLMHVCPSQCHAYLYAVAGNKKHHARRRLVLLAVSIFASILVLLEVRHRINDRSSSAPSSRRPGTSPSFLSFDMGGSGLKLLPLKVIHRNGRREATPMGGERKLGYIPINGDDPIVWVQQKVREHIPSLKSAADWPDFAMSGSWDLFKLYGPGKDETLLAMEKGGILQSMCDVGYNKKGDLPACDIFRPPAEILGFVQKVESVTARVPQYKGFFSDDRTQFEGGRAKLEQLAEDNPASDQLNQRSEGGSSSATSTYPFVNWGFGTGQTISWVAKSQYYGEFSGYSPWVNRTASEKPVVLDPSTVASALTLNRKNASDSLFPVYMIKVKIPEEIKMSLEKKNSSFLESVGGEMHFYSIMHGNNWKDESIRQELREIYRSFFRNQVMGAITEGFLPKPRAMVFSGGLENHARISNLVQDILSQQNIESIAAHPDGVHCGVVRLAYPTDDIYCRFSR